MDAVSPSISYACDCFTSHINLIKVAKPEGKITHVDNNGKKSERYWYLTL